MQFSGSSNINMKCKSTVNLLYHHFSARSIYNCMFVALHEDFLSHHVIIILSKSVLQLHFRETIFEFINHMTSCFRTLVWEDGFCDNLKPRGPMVSPSEDLYLENSNKIFSSTFSSNVLDGNPGGYPVGLAVAEMSSASHVVGKG